MRVGWKSAVAIFAIAAAVVGGCATAVLERKAEPPPAPQKVAMQAKRFEYTPQTVTVKKGQPVELSLSTLDRLHGFSAPDLGLHAEIWPGKTTVLTFTPQKAGTFELHCDIFCGVDHENMAAKIIVAE